jgi:hypothetical protein
MRVKFITNVTINGHRFEREAARKLLNLTYYMSDGELAEAITRVAVMIGVGCAIEWGFE